MLIERSLYAWQQLLFVVTPLSRVVTPAINTLSSGYAQSVTTWRCDNEKIKSWEEESGCCATLPASEVCASPIHGFALWASPAVKHGVSPPGTVDECAVLLGRVEAIRVWADRIRVWVEKLMEFSSTIRAWADRIRVWVEKLMEFSNTIRAWTDTIRLSTDSLIILPRTIRIFARNYIIRCISSKNIWEKI